jgi:hypothetical protein
MSLTYLVDIPAWRAISRGVRSAFVFGMSGTISRFQIVSRGKKKPDGGSGTGAAGCDL